MSGVLIAIEGIDGVGKTTVAKHLEKVLKEREIDCVVLKEPSDSVYGKKIKEADKRFDPREELELFLLDRKIDVEERILPALKEGKVVIMDRYYFSNIAYQSARGIDASYIESENERIAPKPDLVIILDVDPQIALERIKFRKKLSLFEDVEYLKLVRQKFLELARKEKVVVVDASRNLENVISEVEKHVFSLLHSYNFFRG